MSEVRTASVVGVRELSAHVRELTLSPPSGPIAFSPGQWLSLRLPVGERPPLIRAYSLASAPTEDNTLHLCFDRIEGGLGSGYLWNLEPGETVEFTGPLGNFVLPETTDDLLFAARYTGIVPFRAMLQAVQNGQAAARRIHLVYGVPREEEAVYHEELAALASRQDWFTYDCIAGSGSELAFLEAQAAQWMPFTPMICGVREFTFPVRAFLMETLGFERRAIKVENYNGPTAR